MYKNLNPASLGVSGRQSELIELTLTYGFRGLDLDAAELIKRATLQGVEEAAKYIRSGKVKVGGWTLPLPLSAAESVFNAGLERLPSVAETAREVGFTYCTAEIDPACDDLPYHENFERHRERLVKVGEALAARGIRLAIQLRATAKQREGRRYPFIHQAEELLTLLRTTGSDKVGLALDTWSWKVGGGGYDQLAELSDEQIVTVSIADVPLDVDVAKISSADRLLPAEESIPEYARLVADLAKRKYEGPFTIVPHARQLASLNRDASVEKCAKILDQIWLQAGLTKPPRPVAVGNDTRP
jgi:sugar phosphate isomerase/epimerase